MKYLRLLLAGVWSLLLAVSFFACGEGRGSAAYRRAESLNLSAYRMRYKNLEESERLASEALAVGREYPSLRAEALNNLGFCAFIRMDFERADSLLGAVYDETADELECLVADVGMMKICQRTAMNKEFYDYRNSALRRMKRIGEDKEALADPRVMHRYRYACSDFAITSAVYYYYLQQEPQSLEAIDGIEVEEELKGDTAQLLYYYYMKGSGGMYEAATPEDVVVGEFDYLLDCLMLSHEQGYLYFEANASQAMAELLKTEKNFRLLTERRPGMMRVINQADLPWEELVMGFSRRAIDLFTQYGDWYQISGSYRTLASCLNEQHRYEEALDCLSEALSYVNLHHEKYYHCHDTIDRLKPYVPMATHSIELQWINNEGIKTVPEWIARFREQLSVTYAALGMKPESDYNRNIYLDILDYTRQDKELESRYMALEKESGLLSMMLWGVVLGIGVLVLLLWVWNRHWRIRYNIYVNKLTDTLDICRQIISSVPADAEEVEDVTDAIGEAVKAKILRLVDAQDMTVCLKDEAEAEENKGVCSEIHLETADKKRLGVWKIYTASPLKKDDKALLKIIAPYISWTLENGLSLISLGDERKRLEKEQYVHEQHLIENKRQNVVKKACLFIVTGITPYIDRVINEVYKLTSLNYLADKTIKEGKYQYISELTSRINEYNDILAMWIKMRQGSLSLNIESFELNPLFEVLQKSRRTFEAKHLALVVTPTEATVKADKALTLFMMNTLAENARKYTPQGGKVEIYAWEADDYVEISVQDNGRGLSSEDVQRILGEKVYDSGKIGMNTAVDAEELRKNKGYGFGLMNCKGIIEKYRKTNDLFKVCSFHIESEPGKGSRFYFRLPKGVRRLLGIIALWCVADVSAFGQTTTEPVDSLLLRANDYANKVYQANVEGEYPEALEWADSALVCLNRHYRGHSGKQVPLLQLEGEGQVAELTWFADGFDTDYYILLDVRNEVAVAHLALGDLEGYRYNNNAYTALYKQISVDASLEGYCIQMEKSANGKLVAIMLCIAVLVILLLGFYLLYFRHLLAYRYNLEQVLEINRQAFSLPLSNVKEGKEMAALLVSGLYRAVHELIPLEGLGIAMYSEEQHTLHTAFTSPDREEEVKAEMTECYTSGKTIWNAGKRLKCLPLCVEVGEETLCVGVWTLMGVQETEREDDRLMLDLVASYLAVIVYNAMELVAQKYRDIEVAQDEARRLQREENQFHIQNMVLDNCLSTIKHETIYYPNKIKQIVDRLMNGRLEGEERRQVEAMAELVGYYKDIFTILSSCAARQLEEITFRRGVVKAGELVDYAARVLKKSARKAGLSLEWSTEVEDVKMTGDVIQLKYLLENLIGEAVDFPEDGALALHIYKEGAFVRFDFIDRRRSLSQEELNQLFYPHLSRMKTGGGEELTGTEYLICKQIIRDHDEFAGCRGCRINAQPAEGGGFMVWFTVPVR
ncbi:MAG: DUF5113 domain-containing protein [Bacteroides sp.]|nr:DUF5113 domain-containing protein [Bacteroides sp.]